MNRRGRTLALLASVLLFAGFAALGAWQVQRLAWKTALIARVDARVAAAPVAPPPPAAWPGVSAARDEYRRVRVRGVFDHRHEAFVQALTAAGAGFWVLTPLRTDQGFTVLVNRGFVPPDRRAPAMRAAALPSGQVTVTGLLRLSEPHGGFMRANDPAAARWYSRDVPAIARAAGIADAAPYFIDADATPNAGGWPRGGLTVVRFHNSHLVYALTWFTLAGMTAAWGGWLALEPRRRRRTGADEAPSHDPAAPPAAASPHPPGDETARRNLMLLVQLRWIALAGQVVTIAIVQLGFGIRLPLAQMGGVLAAFLAVNLLTLVRARRPARITNSELFLSLTLDALVLTALLYLSGGATNPFTALFLLQVILGAVLLEAWAVWAMVVVTALCFTGLALIHRPLELPAGEPDLFALYIRGALVAFALDAVLLVIFISRINANLRRHDAQLAALRERAAEEDHIVRMGLLASGAAHELGTPLATLAVILGDWRRSPKVAADPELAQEVAEMQAEVARCKTIVTGVLASAGEARPEAAEVSGLKAYLHDVFEDWKARRTAPRATFEDAIADDPTIAADSALRQAIHNLLDNALEAAPAAPLELSARLQSHELALRVRDGGPGFAPQVLGDVGKPYNSTKGRPGGGLGLFLAVNVARKLGGRVEARNRETGGAEVTLFVPIAALAMETAP